MNLLFQISFFRSAWPASFHVFVKWPVDAGMQYILSLHGTHEPSGMYPCLFPWKTLVDKWQVSLEARNNSSGRYAEIKTMTPSISESIRVKREARDFIRRTIKLQPSFNMPLAFETSMKSAFVRRFFLNYLRSDLRRQIKSLLLLNWQVSKFDKF